MFCRLAPRPRAALALGVAIVAVALLGATPSRAAPASIERLTTFLDNTRSLTGTFTQTLYDERDRAVETSSGTLHLERASPHGRFRWVYEQPFPQLIVGDGSRVWVHDPELEQVTVRDVDDALGDTPAALLAGDGNVESRFDVRDLGERRGVAWVGLTPRGGGDGSFQSMALGFSGDRLSGMELVDAFGQRTVLEFDRLRVNASLDASLFRFQPPAGADVLRN